MADLAAVTKLARDCLTLRVGDRADVWLWEHSERVMHLARLLIHLPELQEDPADEAILSAACLFHLAGWAEQVRRGEIAPRQVLQRPTSDLQRELAASVLIEQAGDLLPDEVAQTAAEAIRQANNRYSKMPEAIVLAEAENLEGIGVIHVLRQFRQNNAEGRPLDQLLVSWQRQLEYSYWEARINDSLRFELTREVARQRLQAIERFMTSLADEREGDDVRRVLRGNGIEC